MQHLLFGSQVQIQPRSAGLFIYPSAKGAWEPQPLDFWVWISVSLHEAFKNYFFKGGKTLSAAKPGVKASHRERANDLSLCLSGDSSPGEVKTTW